MVQLVRNFLACLSGTAKSNTLKHTGNMSILMRSSQKPGRCRMTSSLPSKFWKIPYLCPWQPTWQAGGETAGRGWRLPSLHLLPPWQQDFPGLPGPWAFWPAIEPWEGTGESKWVASLLSDLSGTSALQERHRFLSLYIFLLFWNQIWLRLVSLAGFFPSLFPLGFNSELPRVHQEQFLVIP